MQDMWDGLKNKGRSFYHLAKTAVHEADADQSCRYAIKNAGKPSAWLKESWRKSGPFLKREEGPGVDCWNPYVAVSEQSRVPLNCVGPTGGFTDKKTKQLTRKEF